jgi:hypothetical protein
MDEKRHTELELKFAADHLDGLEFRQFMLKAGPSGFEHFQHDDIFWQRGANIVRHRVKGEGAGELTSKSRKSEDSLVDRVEINLRFSPKVTVADVETFLGATGYERLFTLRKSYVDVFDFEREGYKMEAALYTVGRVDEWGTSGDKSFLEFEIKPGDDMDKETALEILSVWGGWATVNLDVGNPLNLSLFEQFSKLISPSVGTNYKI